MRSMGQTHEILLTEMDCKGVFEVRCRCGEVSWTAHGEAHAAEIGLQHLFQIAQQGGKVMKR